jgi:hypothetical protein
MQTTGRWLLAAAALALPCLSARADVLVLKDGKRVEGDVTEQGDTYEVKTKYGNLSVRKDEVSRVVNVKGLMRDGDSYRSGVRTLLEEVQKEGIKPDDRKTKLAMMGETVRKALEIYREARSVSSGEMAADLDQRIEEMTKALAVCQTVPDTLEPVAPPKVPADPAKGPVAAPAVPAPKPVAVPAKPAVRVPVPAGPEAADAEKEIKSIFKDEYPKRAAADRAALARKLLQAGEETKDDAVLQFVTLREARDLAASAGDLDTALTAIDQMGKAFLVDVPDLKATAFASAARSVEADEGERVFTKGLDLMDRLAGDGEFDAAVKLAVPLEDLARRLRSAEHIKTAQARAKECRVQLTEWNRVRPSAEKLKETPDDAEACLAVGKYYAAARKWAAALPLLAKGSHAGLKEAAAKELAKPADAAALADAGDLWFALAEKETGAFKAVLQDRARELYEKALPGLAGLAKAKVEKRLQSATEVASGSGDWIDLLRIANPATHAVAGKWTRQGNELEVAAGDTHDLLEFPRGAQGSYDLQAVFTIKEGTRHEPAIMLPVGTTQTALMFDAWDAPGVCGLACVDGVAPNGGNPTTFPTPKGLRGVTPPGPPNTVSVRVRIEGANAQVQVDVNGRKIIDWKGKQASLTAWTGWPVKSKTFGLGACQTAVTWHAVRVRLLDPLDRSPKKK